MALLAFALECSAVGAVAGIAVSVPVAALGMVIARARGLLSAGARADLLLVAGLLPTLSAVAVMAAAAAPSFGSALGLADDHCHGHPDPLHICFLHPSRLGANLAAIGAFALALWLWRSGALVVRLWRSSEQVRNLERLAWPGGGVPGQAFPVAVVPASRFCHAIGLFRRRILVSGDLWHALTNEEFAGALAHEEAHLQRRDPLATALLAAASLFAFPFVAGLLRHWHRQASEEACDEAAVARVGDGAIVAAALVKVAAMHHGRHAEVFMAPGFCGRGLEERVHRLLEARGVSVTPARWPLFASITWLVFVTMTIAQAHTIHHGAEHLLGQIF